MKVSAVGSLETVQTAKLSTLLSTEQLRIQD